MAYPDEQRFQLLMSEKAFADTQIGGFFDLHVKVLTFLGAAFVLFGWFYSDNPKSVDPHGIAYIALAIVVIGCSVILQAIVLYGSSLGYLEYKVTTLNREFSRLLSLREVPFTALRNWRRSATQPPVTLSAISLFVMHLALSSLLLRVAWNHGRDIKWFYLAVIGTAVYLAVTLCAEVLVFRALRVLMEQGTPKGDVTATATTSTSEGSE